MYQVRKSTFETNSSSCHSLVITDKEICKLEEFNIPTNKDNKVIFKVGEYNWGLEELTEQEEKLTYLMTMVAGNWPNSIEEIQMSSDYKILNDFLLKYCNGIEFPKKFLENGYDGHIDHQSITNLKSFLSEYYLIDGNNKRKYYNEDYSMITKREVTIDEVVLDPNITIIIDNDNH